MNRPPRGEGSQGFFWCSVSFAHEEVTGRQNRAVGAGAQPPGDEEVKPGEVLHQLDPRLRDPQVRAVVAAAAAWDGVVAGPRGDDEDHPVPAGHQQPLQVGHRRRQRDFVDDDDFSRDMIKAILLLCYSRKLALTVSAAEAGIVQAVYDHWSIGGKGAAELRHLREDGRDGVS